MTHSCRRVITFCLAGGMLLSAVPAPATTASTCIKNLYTGRVSPVRAAAVTAFFLAFGRMIYKAEMEGDDETTKKRFFADKEWLSQNSSKLLTSRYAKRVGGCLWNILDNVIIGSPGKKRGIKAWGSKLVMDGDPEFGDTEIGPNGEELKFRRYSDRAPYGVMGKLWGVYLYPIISNLKELKTLGEVISWTGNEIGLSS